MSLQSELKKTIKQLKREGWTEEMGSKHRKMYHPKGGFISMSISPSCHHAVKNIQHDIKRLKKNYGECD